MSKTKLPTVKAIMDENNCTAEAAESIRARLEVEADRAYRRKTGRHFLTVVKAHDLERHPELAVQDTIRPKLTEWNIQDHLKTAEDRAAYIFATVEEVGTPDALADAAAVLMIGHDPKGSTEGKSMADRGAGSYTAGADYDFSFALSPHELDGYTVLSTSCRYRQSPPDLTIRFDPERQIFEAEADTPATVRQTRRGGGGANADPKDKAERERLKLDALEKAVRDFAAKSDLMSMGTFRQSIRATPEGAAFGRDTLRVAIDALIEKKVIAKTAAKVRTEGGGVKNMKNGGYLVGTSDKVKAYDDSFNELPLQP